MSPAGAQRGRLSGRTDRREVRSGTFDAVVRYQHGQAAGRRRRRRASDLVGAGHLGNAPTRRRPPRRTSCTPPAGVPATARQVYRDVDSAGAAPTSTCSSTTARSGRARGRTCPDGSAATACAPCHGAGPATARRPARIFPLGTMTAPDGQTFQFFGNGVNPGVQRHVAPGRGRRLLGRDAQHRRLQHARHPDGGHLHEPGRVPHQLPGLVLAGRAHRRQHGPEPLRRRPRRAGARGGDLPPPPLVRRQRQQQADIGLRVARQRQPDLRAPAPRPGEAYFVIR